MLLYFAKNGFASLENSDFNREFYLNILLPILIISRSGIININIGINKPKHAMNIPNPIKPTTAHNSKLLIINTISTMKKTK
ncbi:MAG: hypothetical protein ACKVOU_12290, partial [Cytophagales bacterium]